MPESKRRLKAAQTAKNKAQAEAAAAHARNLAGPNAPWFLPLMVGLMVAGLAWVVTFYVSQGVYPIPGLGAPNLLIGFALMMGGFFMTTRWR